MSRYTYPHSIENGAGERLTFVRRLPGPTGDRLEGYNVVQPGAGPPMHVHWYQEEGFIVERGRIGYQRLGEPERYAGPGESIVFPAGIAHRFWNAGDGELRCSAWLEPADNIVYVLGSIFESQTRAGAPRPGTFDAAFLLRRYRSEFAMLAIPAPVQRWVFPVVVAIGRLLGKYARYADAPEPVRRPRPAA
jgi:quercetin dioxygenase-like cupin family protein